MDLIRRISDWRIRLKRAAWLRYMSFSGTPADALNNFTSMRFPMFRRDRSRLMTFAMVDFDYMSDGGKGWFKDIDALAATLSPARRKVFLCLHGWYDWCGRYSFDVKTKQIDKEWTIFGNAPRYKNQRSSMDVGGESVDSSLDKCEQDFHDSPIDPGAARLRKIQRLPGRALFL